LLAPLYVGLSRDEIRRDTEPGIRHLLDTVASLYTSSNPKSEAGARHLMQLAQKARETTYEQACDSMALFETPEACVERLQGLSEEFGMGRLICWFNPGGTIPHVQVMRSMRLFAERVLPHFA